MKNKLVVIMGLAATLGSSQAFGIDCDSIEKTNPELARICKEAIADKDFKPIYEQVFELDRHNKWYVLGREMGRVYHTIREVATVCRLSGKPVELLESLLPVEMRDEVKKLINSFNRNNEWVIPEMEIFNVLLRTLVLRIFGKENISIEAKATAMAGINYQINAEDKLFRDWVIGQGESMEDFSLEARMARWLIHKGLTKKQVSEFGLVPAAELEELSK